MVAFLIGLVFFAALVISLGMIFAVKNINVKLITYADEYGESYSQTKNSLNVFKGESIMFIGEENIAEAITDSRYSIAAFEKIFPCTINVTLKERLETFAVSVGGFYSVYDSDGKFLRSSVENANANDGSPNVELTGIAIENLSYIAGIASCFKDNFKALRSIVTSINLDSRPEVEGYTEKLVFNMRCGLKIQIDDYTRYTNEKILSAYEKFCTLTDRQKLGGTLRSYRMGGEEGIINADYSVY